MAQRNPERRAFPLALALALPLLWPGEAAAAERIVVMQGLDKVTARVSAISATIGQPVRFGTLEITARACQKRPPEETPETAAFLEIREIRFGEEPKPLFSGWMFASSPALNALQHPVYDVWVRDCRDG